MCIRDRIIPLIGPGLVTTAIFSFLLAWNDLLFAIILTTSEKVRTLSVLVTSYNASRDRLYGEMFAVMTLSLIHILKIQEICYYKSVQTMLMAT